MLENFMLIFNDKNNPWEYDEDENDDRYLTDEDEDDDGFLADEDCEKMCDGSI
jgi:hypothetical protein